MGLLSVMSSAMWAQQLTISGVVKDGNGQIMPGVSVVEKGTINGTITDMDGVYQVSVDDPSKVLVFSFIGMTTQEVTVGSNTSINITMQDDVIGVEEVVVVGYGTQKKANLTGAVASMKVDDAINQPVTNTTQLLQGKMSGVQLTQGSGQPGRDGATIHIRGVGTNGNSAPMVIIDGMERSMGDIAPSDIESISVLKDAASAAIYGARAANGVILVTTKSGKSGGMKINFNSYFGWQEATVLPDLVDSPTYAGMINEATGEERYTDEMIQAMRDGSDRDRFANTNWADELFRTAPVTNQYLSFSGGSEKTNYMLSVNYMNQEGIMLNTASQRYNVRAKIDSEVKSWLKVGINIDGSVRNIQEPPTALTGDNGLMNSIYFDSPVAPVKYTADPDSPVYGQYAGSDGSPNSYPIRNVVFRSQLGESLEDQYRFNTRLYANIKLAPGLSFETSVGYRYYNNLQSKYNPSFELYDADGNIDTSKDFASIRNANAQRITVLNENIFRYTKKIGKHSFNGLLGHSTQQYRLDSFNATKQDFVNDEVHEIEGATTMVSMNGTAEELNMQSFFGRVGYNFDERYLLEMNVRVDGSSRFPSDNLYGTFPSLSAAWRLSEEQFAAPLTDMFSNVKLRASWGMLGNQEIAEFYPHEYTWKLGYNYILPDGSVTGGSAIAELKNPDLKWESTESYNFGLDVGMHNGLNVTADYFVKYTRDLLIRLPVSNIIGITQDPFQNGGEALNRGWEIAASYQDNIGDFKYHVGFNVTKIHNEWTNLEGLDNINGKIIQREGHSLFSLYGYEVEGIFQDGGEVSDHAFQSNYTAAGDLKFKDQPTIDTDGDGIPDTGDGVINEDDRVVIGNQIPEFTYGISGGFEYKGIDFSFLFQGVQNVDSYTGGSGNHSGLGDRMNWVSDWEDYWTPENTDATHPRLGGDRMNDQPSSFYVEDASYLRLKNIELGYTLPASVTERINIGKLRFYVSGQNLLTFSKFDHWDPERSINNSHNQAYPLTKTFTVGLNATF